MSASNQGIDVSEEDKRMHREAEKTLKEVNRMSRPSANSNFASVWQAKSKMASQVKVGNPVRPILIFVHAGLPGATPGVRRLWKVHNSQGACVFLRERPMPR